MRREPWLQSTAWQDSCALPRAIPIRASLLLIDHALDQSPRPHRTKINVEIVELLVGMLVDGLLLRGQHEDIFGKDTRICTAQEGRDIPVMNHVVAGNEPEIMAGFFGLWRDHVNHDGLESPLAGSLLCASAGGCYPDIDRDGAWRPEIDDLPAVDPIRHRSKSPIHLFRPEGRWLDIHHPARHRDRIVTMVHVKRRLGDRCIADAAGM